MPSTDKVPKKKRYRKSPPAPPPPSEEELALLTAEIRASYALMGAVTYTQVSALARRIRVTPRQAGVLLAIHAIEGDARNVEVKELTRINLQQLAKHRGALNARGMIWDTKKHGWVLSDQGKEAVATYELEVARSVRRLAILMADRPVRRRQ